MDPREFLDVASDWAVGPREAEWRSSVSRAYYAVFHLARKLLQQVGFQAPRGDSVHQYVYYRLHNCGEPQVVRAADLLRDLRVARNKADYDLDDPVIEKDAIDRLNEALDIDQILAALAANPALLAQLTQAMRDYERRALGVVTWRSP
jgi:uncharacterized protein (UPF0332 family)